MVSQLLELQSFAAMKILNYTCEDMVQAEGREELMQSLSSTEHVKKSPCFNAFLLISPLLEGILTRTWMPFVITSRR
ncbi:hypothetical protein Bca4012_018197 [Brassica carinata]